VFSHCHFAAVGRSWSATLSGISDLVLVLLKTCCMAQLFQSLSRCFMLYLSNFYPCHVLFLDYHHCVMLEGELHVFVEHWHYDGIATTPTAGRMMMI
jgi:hypothetical protein